MDAQKANWEHGRITADSYLDAVEQFVSLVVNERHHLTAYNTTLTFVSACEGLLLEDNDIIVVKPTRENKPHQTAGGVKDDQAQKASLTREKARSQNPPRTATSTAAAAKAAVADKEIWQMTLAQAIRIGLDNSDHHLLAAYNSALTFVSECKGTLLEDHHIVAQPRPHTTTSTSGLPKLSHPIAMATPGRTSSGK